MKRRRRSRSVLAVSLFPFLAVLICTLGVLIVLLVLAVKAADSQAAVAQTEADAKLQMQFDKARLDLEAREIQIEGLKLVRPDALQRLEEARATRSHFEDELRQLQREARSLAEALLTVENERRGHVTSDVTDEQLKQVRKQIEKAKKKLEKRRAEQSEVSEVTWSIVPYRGTGGTDRRPIFVECLADRLVIRPLAISISRDELRAAIFPGNMLDAALLAIREHWQRYGLEGTAGRAYPLIVVRPQGAKTFQVVKNSLKDWDDEFGYEIVDDDKNIYFGEHDSELAAEVKSAIAEARERQTRLSVAAAHRRRVVHSRGGVKRSKSQQRPGFTVSSTGGGFVFNGAHQASRIGVGQELPEDGSDSEVSNSYKKIRSEDYGVSRDVAAGGAAGAGDDHSVRGMQAAAAHHNEGQNEKINSTSKSEDVSSTCLAVTRGANWALPSRSAGAVPYVRPIRLECYIDQFVLKGSTGDKVIPIHTLTTDSVDALVSEVWSQIESWGVAGANGYWKPQLKIAVMPGGYDQFVRLQQMLGNSGILVEGARR